MDIPNLFLIDQKFLNYYVIGIDNNSMVLSTEDMGCFTGDCFCCAEDGSDKPKVNMDYSYGLFTYSSENSNYSVFYIKALGLGIYTKNILEFDGDVDSYINVNNEIPSNLFLQYDPPYGYGDGCGFVFGLLATNECGTSSIEVGCHCVFCDAYYVIDCVTQKIKIIKRAEYEDAKHSNPQYIEEFYDLGDVPDIDYYKDNGCGLPCHIQEKAACIFNKNSLVLEYSNFEDISEEYFVEYLSTDRHYYKIESSGVSAINGTFIFPLYVRKCEGYDLDPQGDSGEYVGYSREIAYDRPEEIYLGELITTVYYEYHKYDFWSNSWRLERKYHSIVKDDLILNRKNGISIFFISMTSEWMDIYYPPYSGTYNSEVDTTVSYIYGTPILPILALSSLEVNCGNDTNTDFRIGGVNPYGFGTYIPPKIGKFKGYYANL